MTILFRQLSTLCILASVSFSTFGVNLTAFCDNDPLNRVDTLGGNSLGWGEGLAESSVAKSGDPRELLQFVTTPMPDEERAPFILAIPMTDQQWQEEQAQKAWWSNLPLHEKVFDALPPLSKFHSAADAYIGGQPTGEIGKYLIQGGIETALMAITWRGMGGARGTAPAKGAAVGSIRERVLANIAESRTARMSSRFGQLLPSGSGLFISASGRLVPMVPATGWIGTWRNIQVKSMALRFGRSPSIVRYVDEIGSSNGRRFFGGVHFNGQILIDRYAFSRHWLLGRNLTRMRQVLGHEIGHTYPIPSRALTSITPINPTEFWASFYGATLRGLAKKDVDALLRHAYTRYMW